MSSNERSSPKSLSTNESNIPVWKRCHVDSAKKPKKRNDIPDLQRYIETIVKAQKDYERENGKSQRNTKKVLDVLEKPETSPQSEGNKQNEFKPGGDIKTRHHHHDADGEVERWEEGIERMDNSYECDMNPILEIEKFLRKLYPNPYDLDKVSEFQVVKASENFRENPLKPPSLFDVIPSSVDITRSNETLVSQMSTENDNFLKADIFIDENMFVQNFDDILVYSPDDYFKSNTRTEVTRAQNDKPNTIDDSKMSSLLKNKIESRVSSPIDKLRSRPSSAESEIRHFNPDNPTGMSRKRNSSRRTNTERPSKAMPSKNKSDALVVLGKQNSNHHGKLNLIGSYDSNEIIQGDTIDERSRYEEGMTEQTKKIQNVKNASRKHVKDSSELHQLYHVMDKTAESILHITSRNEKGKDHDQNDTSQDSKTDNRARSLDLSRRSSAKDLEPVSSSDRLQRTRKRLEKDHSSPRQIEKSLKNKSAIIATFHKDRSKYEKERNYRTKEGGDDDNSKPETRKDETYVDDNDFGELSGTSQRIDDVLQYMCDCLRKFTNDSRERTRSSGDVTALENIENRKSKSRGRNDSKDTQRITYQEGNPANVTIRDVTTPTPNEHKTSPEAYYPLEIVRNKSLTPGWSLETKDTSRKLNVGKHRRRKRPQTPQSRTLELSPISLTTSNEELMVLNPLTRRPEIPDITPNNEPIGQIVERQNELGGYNEEQPREFEVARESQPRSLYPVRFRKQKRDSYRILKNALDTEEKLLADNLILERKSSSTLRNSFMSSRSLAPKPSPFALMEEIKQQRSSFVICVSSVPRHLRTGYPTKIPYATSLSISLSNLRKSLDVKKIRKEPKTRKLKKLSLEHWVKHMGRHYTYRFEVDLLLTVGREYITHAAIVVGLAHVYATSSCEDYDITKNSECYLKVKSGPPKKSLFVENLNVTIPSTSITSSSMHGTPEQVTSSVMLSLQEERVEEEEEENAEVGEAESERTLEESEENMLALEQNDESGQMVTCSGTSITYVIHNESSDTQTVPESETDRKKIQDLLMRTYHLQHKLHRYLHRVSCPQTSPYCPLNERDTSVDVDAGCKNDGYEIFPRMSPMDIQTPSPSTDNKDSRVYWLLEPNVTKETQTREHDGVAEVEKVDHATSYRSQSNGSCRTVTHIKPDSHGEVKGGKEETPMGPNSGNDDDDDDRSSTYSFKSSNDFSELNEIVNVEEKPKVQKTKNKNSRFLQKIFHELELFRKTLTTTKEKTPDDRKETKQSKDDRIVLDKPKDVVESTGDGKPSGKALKTVFKGKESTTELTIGLKDVPITDGSNISVEKKKFSQNHTKISISISKEKPEEVCDVTRRYFKFSSDNIHTTLSSYYFDSLRPTISESETRYSRLENDPNKSLNGYDTKEEGERDEDEEEDDDYKSVASSMTSKSDTDKPEGKESDETTLANGSKPLPTRTFTKHRFDFYRKMSLDADYDMDRTKRLMLNSVSRYKELEPLKEALTEMQLRMRQLKRNSYFTSSEYYQRALKLAKMSAGFCQSCGSRSVLPENSFTPYKDLLPRRTPSQCRKHYLSSGVNTNPNSSFYSFRSSSGDLRTRFCDLDLHQSSYILRGPTHSTGPILGDVPIFMTKM